MARKLKKMKENGREEEKRENWNKKSRPCTERLIDLLQA